MIETLFEGLRSTISAGSGLDCVYITPTGEVGVTSPAEFSRLPVEAAWWTRNRRTAQEVVTAINRAGPRDLDQATAEVLAAARRVDTARALVCR